MTTEKQYFAVVGEKPPVAAAVVDRETRRGTMRVPPRSAKSATTELLPPLQRQEV